MLLAMYTEPALRVHIIHCVCCVPAQAGALISSSSKESACTFACRPLSCLFLSSRTDFNADERRRCANVKGGCGKGEREYLKSRLMIRDDMRHSSLSDVWLDCRYCSLSFIFCELATDARTRVRMCAGQSVLNDRSVTSMLPCENINNES